MSKENNFKSSIADEIEAFIAEKHSMGFKYDGEVRVLRRFDEYWSDHGYGKTGLAPDNLEDWCRKSDTVYRPPSRRRSCVMPTAWGSPPTAAETCSGWRKSGCTGR